VINLLQEDTPAGGAGSATTLVSNAVANNLTNGSYLIAWIAAAAGTDIHDVTDSNGQLFLRVGHVSDATDTSDLWCYVFNNNTFTNKPTVTVTWNATIGERNIHVQEFSGAKNQTPDTSNFPALIVNPGTATDAISVALTSSAQPAMIAGVVSRISGAGAPVAGTGFTGTTHFATGVAFDHGIFETKRVTATGSNPCTWTDSVNGGSATYLAMAIILDEAPVVAPVMPFGPMPKQLYIMP
jgi:hypothetical protein